MDKKIFLVTRKLVTILLLGVTVAGCKSIQYGVEISNVPRANIKAVYIRNAGTTNWGNDIVANLNNIDRTKYSQLVDIRVVDSNGVVYSKYDVPFNEDAFLESGTTSYLNGVAGLFLMGATVVAGYYAIVLLGGI